MRHPPLTLKSLNKCLRLLGLPPPPPPGGSGEQLTQSIVKASYNKMALRYHPDNKKEGDDKKFKNITEARDLLLNHFEQNRHREDVFRSLFNEHGGVSSGGVRRGNSVTFEDDPHYKNNVEFQRRYRPDNVPFGGGGDRGGGKGGGGRGDVNSDYFNFDEWKANHYGRVEEARGSADSYRRRARGDSRQSSSFNHDPRETFTGAGEWGGMGAKGFGEGALNNVQSIRLAREKKAQNEQSNKRAAAAAAFEAGGTMMGGGGGGTHEKQPTLMDFKDAVRSRAQFRRAERVRMRKEREEIKKEGGGGCVIS